MKIKFFKTRRVAVVIAVPTLLAGLTLSGSAVADSPMISGVLQNASGQTTSGMVELTAEPDLTNMQIGDTFSDIVVIPETATAGDGSFVISQAQVSASAAMPQLEQLAAANNGWVDFVLIGKTADGHVGDFYFSRELTPTGSWGSKHQPKSASVVAASSPAINGASPNDSPPQCWDKVLNSTTHQTRLGENHRWYGTTAGFAYGKTSDSTLDVMYSPGGVNWSADGSVHISTSVGVRYAVPDTHPYNGQFFTSKFKALKLYTYWNGVGMCNPGYHIRYTTWLGGLVQGHHFDNTYDGFCQNVASENRSLLGAGGTVSRTAMNGFHYSFVAHLFGVGVGGSSGFSSDASYHYHTKYRIWICGESGHTPPAQAPNVAIGARP